MTEKLEGEQPGSPRLAETHAVASGEQPGSPRLAENHGGKSRGSPRKLRLLAAVVLLGVLAGFATWYAFIREPAPTNDLERFKGDWQVSVAGRDTPNVVRVEGDRWQYQAGPTDGKAYRLTVNEAADPREIELELIDAPKLKGPPVKIRGVYAFDGNNTVRLRINPATQPRPKTLDDTDAMEWVLTRVKLQEAPEPGR